VPVFNTEEATKKNTHKSQKKQKTYTNTKVLQHTTVLNKSLIKNKNKTHACGEETNKQHIQHLPWGFWVGLRWVGHPVGFGWPGLGWAGQPAGFGWAGPGWAGPG